MGNCFKTDSRKENQLSSQKASEVAELPNRDHPSASSSPTEADKGKSIAESSSAARTERDILSSPNLKAFTLADLQKATTNFHPKNLIGEGGFGYVYKGWMHEQALGGERRGFATVLVAVKMLKPEGFQGHKEWLSEVNYLGQLHHPNLVKLYGYCWEEENRLLVYEYLPKGSLEDHLFGNRTLPWNTRIRIAIDAARGLSFLHDSEQQVIYRDFKSSNILLDSEFNAKLSDFGLAKAGPTGDNTHVSTQVLGTHGYADPEYIATGRLTSMSDVYSYGVVLLELLTGRRAIERTRVDEEKNLVNWVKHVLPEGRKVSRIMDTKLEGRYNQNAAHTVAAVAFKCIAEAKKRPKMSGVLTALEFISSSRPCPRDVVGRSSHSDAQAEAVAASPVTIKSPPGKSCPTSPPSSRLQTGSSSSSSHRKSPRGGQLHEMRSPRSSVKSSQSQEVQQQSKMKSPVRHEISPEEQPPPSGMKSPRLQG